MLLPSTVAVKDEITGAVVSGMVLVMEKFCEVTAVVLPALSKTERVKVTGPFGYCLVSNRRSSASSVTTLVEFISSTGCAEPWVMEMV